jgi:dihydroorotate dehydrogenase (fumarate)
VKATAIDLTAPYLGLTLRSPLIASAGPLTGDVESAKRLAGAGVGAIVLPSLFEEEIVAEELALNAALEAGTENSPEGHGFFPPIEGATVADRYLANLARIKAAVDVPVIASLNATSVGAWSRYATLVAEAGADALELNVYRVAANPYLIAADVEVSDLELIAEVCRVATLPVAVKLSPYYSAMANFARQVTQAGARGLVLFNRFYQPDIDLETMDVECRLELSTQVELGLPLRWIAMLRPQVPDTVSLAATSGVRSGEDAAKALAVGADAVMMTSELLRSGPERVAGVEAELRAWLAEHDYESAAQLRGSVSRVTAEAGEAFERANYMATLRSWAGVGGSERRR